MTFKINITGKIMLGHVKKLLYPACIVLAFFKLFKAAEPERFEAAKQHERIFLLRL